MRPIVCSAKKALQKIVFQYWDKFLFFLKDKLKNLLDKKENQYEKNCCFEVLIIAYF